MMEKAAVVYKYHAKLAQIIILINISTNVKIIIFYYYYIKIVINHISSFLLH